MSDDESNRTKSTFAERLPLRLFVIVPDAFSGVVSVTAIIGVENVLPNFDDVVVVVMVAAQPTVVVDVVTVVVATVVVNDRVDRFSADEIFITRRTFNAKSFLPVNRDGRLLPLLIA